MRAFLKESVFGALTLSGRNKFRCVTFHVTSSLVCLFLLVVQFIDTSSTQKALLWYRYQRAVHLFCKIRMTFTWTKNVEKNSYYYREFPDIVGNDLKKEYNQPQTARRAKLCAEYSQRQIARRAKLYAEYNQPQTARRAKLYAEYNQPQIARRAKLYAEYAGVRVSRTHICGKLDPKRLFYRVVKSSSSPPGPCALSAQPIKCPLVSCCLINLRLSMAINGKFSSRS